jgi:hypothetical protein
VFVFLGKWEKIGGVDCYVATPEGDYPKEKAILFLPDVFGPQLNNAQVRMIFCACLRCDTNRIPQLLADDFASNGFKVGSCSFMVRSWALRKNVHD